MASGADSEVVVFVEGDEELLRELQAISEEGFEMSEPQPSDSLSDAVDSSIGPQEIQALLQLSTVVFSSTASMLLVIERIINVLSKKGAEIKVYSVDSSKLVVSMDGKSAPEDVVRALKQQ